MDKKKLKALAAELAKGLKTEVKASAYCSVFLHTRITVILDTPAGWDVSRKDFP